jgi:large subunit ribosomal protein L25
MKETKLTAKTRAEKGSASAAACAARVGSRRWCTARDAGLDIQLNEHDFVVMLRTHRSENMIVDLTVEGRDKPVKVMLKAMQHHPLTGRIIHVDFYEVSMTRKIEIEVPVKLVGVPTGVANEGGILEHVLRTLVVLCVPATWSRIRAGRGGPAHRKTLRVRDVKVDGAKFKVLSDPARWSPPSPRAHGGRGEGRSERGRRRRRRTGSAHREEGEEAKRARRRARRQAPAGRMRGRAPAAEKKEKK